MGLRTGHRLRRRSDRRRLLPLRLARPAQCSHADHRPRYHRQYVVSGHAHRPDRQQHPLYVSVGHQGAAPTRHAAISERSASVGTPPPTADGRCAGHADRAMAIPAAPAKVTITTGANSNGNGLNTGLQINTSPVEGSFSQALRPLRWPTAEIRKTTPPTALLGDGGLQKWINTKSDGSGTWNLAYDAGLQAASTWFSTPSAAGSTGLYGFGRQRVRQSSVQLYATNYTTSTIST